MVPRGCAFPGLNVMEVIKGLIRRQVDLRVVIGCVLPFVIAYAFMELMEIWPI